MGSLHVDHALAAARSEAVVLEHRPLAKAVLRSRQHMALAQHDQRDQALVVGQLDAAHAGGVAAHGAHFVFVEADGLATAGAQHDLVVAGGQRYAHQPVIVTQVNGDDAAGPWS